MATRDKSRAEHLSYVCNDYTVYNTLTVKQIHSEKDPGIGHPVCMTPSWECFVPKQLDVSDSR